jgi:hypothetical protein
LILLFCYPHTWSLTDFFLLKLWLLSLSLYLFHQRQVCTLPLLCQITKPQAHSNLSHLAMTKTTHSSWHICRHPQERKKYGQCNFKNKQKGQECQTAEPFIKRGATWLDIVVLACHPSCWGKHQ